MLDGGGASLGTAQGEITIDVSQAQNSLESLGSALGSFTTRATSVGQSVSTFQQSAVGLAQGMQNVGRVVQDLGSTIEEPFILATNSAMDLQSTMAGVNAVMNLTGDQFQSLTGLAQQLGKDTQFTGTEAAQGIEELGKAGISFEDIMSGAATAATDLAAAGGVSVPKAAGVMSAAMQEFGISGADAAKVADDLAGAANASLSDINQLGLGLAQVGGVANAAGMGLDETATFMAIMANNGIRGSDAATSMKNAILALLAPTDKAQEALDGMGVSTLDATGNFKGLEGVSRDFFDVWKTSGQTMSEFLDPLTKVLGRDAVRTILFGMQSIQDEQDGLSSGWDQMESQVTKVGTAHEVASKRMDSLAGSIEILKGSLDVLGENIGLPIIEGIRPVVDAMTEFVNKLIELPPAVLGAVGVIGTLAGIIVSLGGSFLVVGGYILEAVARFEATGISLGEIAAVAGRVTLGLSLLGLAVAAVALAFNTNFLGIRDAVQSVIDNIQALIDKIKLFTGINKSSQDSTGMFSTDMARNISAFGHALDEVLGTDISGFTDSIASMVDGLDLMGKRLAFASSFFAMFERDSKFIQPLSKKVSALGKTIDSVFGTDVSGAFDAAAKGMDAFISLTHDSGWGTFPALVEAIGIALDSVFGPNGVSDALENFAFIAKHVETAWSTSIANGISPLAAALRAASVAAAEVGFDGLANALDDAATFAIQFGDNFKAAQEAIAGNGIVGLPNTILALNKAMEATLGIGLPDFLISAADAMAAFQTAFSNGIEQGLNPFEAAIKGVGAAIGDLFGGDSRNQFFAFVDATKQLGGAVQGLISSGFDRVGQMFSEIGTALSQGDFQGALDAVKSLIADVGTELQNAGQKAIDWAINIGEPALEGWAKDNAGKLGDWIKEKLGGVGDLAGATLAKVQGWFIEVGIPQATGWIQQTGADVLSWVQDQINKFIPAAGATLGKVEGWFIEVGIPEIKTLAGEAGSIKDEIIKWIGDQIVFPNVSELPDISAKVEAFANDMGQNLATLLASAMETIRAAIFGGGGGGGGTGGGLTNVAKGANAGIFDGVESDASQLAGTIINSFLRGLAAGFATGVGQANVATFISSGNFEPLKQQILSALADFAKTIPGDLQALVDSTKAELGGILSGLLDIESWLSESDAHGPVGLGGGPGQGLSRGAVNIQQPLEAAFASMVEAVKTAAAGLKDKILAAVPNPFEGLGEQIQKKADAAANLIGQAGTTVTTALNELVTNIATGGASGGGGGAGGGGDAQIIGAGKNITAPAMTDLTTGATQGVDEGSQDFIHTVGTAVANFINLAVPASILPIDPALSAGIAGAAPSAQSAVADGFSPFIDGVSSETTKQIGTMGSEVNSAVAAAAPGSVAGIGSTLDTAMATAVDGITLQALAQAIGAKIGDAVVAGLAAASGGEAQAGLSAGTGGAANIGSQIAAALSTSIQGADFTSVGTAISAQIGLALSAGFTQAQATGPSTAGVDIGSQIALSLSSAITASDFTVVSQAIQQKIGESLSGGTGGTTQTADTSAVAGEGATIGASIAASLANAILSSDFSVVGQAISQKISEAVSSASSGATTRGAGAGLGGVAGQGGGIASGIVQNIVAEFQGADFSGIGAAVGSKVSDAITTGMQQAELALANSLGTMISDGMVAAETGSEIGSVLTEAIAGTISSTSGTIDIAATAAMTTATTSATGIASAAGPVGTAFTTAIGAGIGSGTGTVTGAATAMVSATIDAASGAAAGASAAGTALDTAIGGGIGSGTGTVTSAATAVMAAASAAAQGSAAASGGAIGAAFDQGIASGIGANAGVVTAAAAAVVNAAVSAAQGAGEISSPSKVMIREVGEPLVDGVIVGMDNKGPDVDKAAQRLINHIVKHVKNMKPLMDQMTQMADQWAGLPILDQIGSQLSTIAGHIDSTIGSVKDSMKGVFKSISDTMKQGRDKLKSDSSSVADSATSSFNSILKDRKGAIRDAMKTTKGGILDISSLQNDVDALRNQSKILARADGGQVFADRVNAMADSLQADKDSALKSAIELFQNLNNQLDNAKKQHRKKGAEAGSEIASGVTDGITASTPAATKSVDSLTDSIINTFNANLSRLPEMADAIGQATGQGLADGLDASQPVVEKSTTILADDMAGGINKSVPQLEGAATSAADKFTTALNSAIQGATGDVTQSGADVGSALSDGATSMIADSPIRSAVTDFVTGLTGEVQSRIGTVGNAGQTIGTAFTDGVSKSAPTSAGKSLTDQVETGITSGVPSATNSAKDAGSTIGAGMESGIENACKPVNTQATGLTDSCVPEGIDAGLPTATRSAADAGSQISDALKGGMDLKKKDVTQSFKGAGEGFGTSLAGGISSKTGDNRNAVTGITSTIGQINAQPQGKTVGTSFGQGIVDGISGQKANIESAARSVVDAAKKAADDEADNGSPSRLFAEVGMNMMLGLQEGLKEGTTGVIAQSEKTTRDIAGIFAGQGMGTAVNTLQNNLGLYTQSIKDALKDTEDVVKKSPFADVLLPTDGTSKAMTTGNPQKLTPVNGNQRNVSIGSITIAKGSRAEKMLLDLADHLQETSGQYVRTK